MVAAAKDPYSGNLDRIQVIKGWLDKKGETHDKVYDVVWSDGRTPRRTAYEAKRFDVKMDDKVPMTVQERA